MPDGKKYGMIAQELETVLPDLVSDTTGIRIKEIVPITLEDGTEGDKEVYYKSITSIGLIPVLIEAVKELSAKVEALENE